MNSINNHFTKTIEHGTFQITEGAISVNGSYLPGQYVRIRGSTLSGGVYKVITAEDGKISLEGLENSAEREFTGYVDGLAVPPDFLELVSKIRDFQDSPSSSSDLASETLPSGYHYTKITGKDGGAMTWQEKFSKDLTGYRRMFANPEAEMQKYGN